MNRATDTLWYFAYGSNLDPATFAGRRGLAPMAARCTRLDGFALCFDLPVGSGERGVANLTVATGTQTWGVAYRITPDDAARLDRSEGVHLGYYDRIAVTVHGAPHDDAIAAFTYRSPHGVAGRKPSARYMGLLLAGARHHGLPPAWIARLEAVELAVDERTGSAPPQRH